MIMKDLKDFTRLIAETLDFKEEAIPEWFNIEEAKDGYFVAILQKGKWLGDLQFKALCVLMRDLKGDYVKGAKTFRGPGPFAKKSSEVPSGPETDFLASHKAPGSAVPAVPSTPMPIQKEYTFLPLASLLSMQFQSRTVQEGPEFDELVESVKALGVLQPILVRPKSGLYEIVYGERRTAAAKKAGLHEIPARIKDLSDKEAYEIQLIENIQRKDLSDMEKARMLDMMITQFGYTQEVLAKKVGKSRLWVVRHLALLNVESVSPGIQSAIQSGTITERQGRELLAASPGKREEILDKANEEGALPSARKMEEIRKGVSCARCGESIQGTPVCLGGNKFYDAECAEAVVEESKSGHGPSIEPGSGEESENVEAKEGEKRGKVEEKSSREEDLKAIGIGEFECTQCNKRFLVEHMKNGKHRLKPIREDE
jgi:ParB family chromosome partitioning protein